MTAATRGVFALALALASLLAGCSGTPAPTTNAPSPATVAAPATVAPAGAAAQPGTQDLHPGEAAWLVDTDRSFLRLRVYRGGTLARLGHNHVIVAPLAGTVRTRAGRVEMLDAATMLTRWQVDDADERARAGAGFESVPDAAAIAGTRTNMFSKALLDAEQFPAISIRGCGGPLADGALPLMLDIELQGRHVPVQLVLRATPTGGGWRAEASTQLTHAQLGLAPFSALGGALKVEERIDVDVQVELAPAG